MDTLKQARDAGKIDQFAKDRDDDAPGDQAAFDATLQSMAGTSKAVLATSDRPGDAD